MDIRPFEIADESAVVALWERCGLLRPWNDPHEDIARRRRVGSHLFLVGVVNGDVVATAMAGYDGHRGWIYYFGVAPEHQRRGLGRQMMLEVERRLHDEGCPKINLQVRVGNDEALAFYRGIGFVQDEVVSLGKRLVDDRPAT